VALAAVLVTDLGHRFATGFAVGGSLGTRLEKAMTAGLSYSLAGWVLAVVGVRLLVEPSDDGLYAALFAGLSIALFGGVADIGVLSHPVAPLAQNLPVARTCVAVAVGGGLGVVAGCLLAIRRPPEARPGEPEPDDGAAVGHDTRAVVSGAARS
jgi:hypothetical protein